MSVTTQQVNRTLAATGAPVLSAELARARGLSSNHTLLRKLSANESSRNEVRKPAMPNVGAQVLQRKCACGSSGKSGECEECKRDGGMVQRRVQTKLAVSEAGDHYEQEADRVADQLAAPVRDSVENTPPRIQRFAKFSTAATAPESVERVLSGPGQPLGSTLRRDMEQRFGFDFSRVRAHYGPPAARSANDVNAHAYTVGHHMVFGPGQYAPATPKGRRLIAHELTHVVQQSGDSLSVPALQRMKKGTDKVDKQTIVGTSTLKPPPPEHVEKIDAAIERIRQVAEGSETYSACHDLFAKHCGGCKTGLNTLSEVFKKAVLRFDEMGLDTGEGAWAIPCDPDIAYTLTGFKKGGVDTLAGNIIHEMGHVCGIRGSARHHLADRIRLGCIRGAPTLLSMRGLHDPAAIVFGFRKAFKNLLGGQLTFRYGMDLDIAGLGADYPSQFASALARAEARAPLWWGGERWGGVSIFAELGGGAGRFRVREPGPGDPELVPKAGVIIGVGARLEWYVPRFFVEGRRYPLALTASIQTMIPLSHEAERFQSYLIGLETWIGD